VNPHRERPPTIPASPSEIVKMSGTRPRNKRPLWVRIGLWGLHTRRAARAFVWLSLALALGCAAYGIRDRRFLVGVILVLAALWYDASIRWVDRFDRWESGGD
jgi:hypothetical protein